jgi:hypothetical protein
MKAQYDFSKGRRGRIQPPPEPPGKTRITIRIDGDVLDYFLNDHGCKAPFRRWALARQAKATLHLLAFYTMEVTSPMIKACNP